MDDVHNPYLITFNQLSSDEREKRSIRQKLINQYAWAIPDVEALAVISEYSPIVEMGAGNGYWKYVIEQSGGDIISYDLDVCGGLWSSVHQGSPDDLDRFYDHTLFLCWPPYNDSMAVESVESFTGDSIIYVGEMGGCTGCDRFHKILTQEWKQVNQVSIPSWPGIYDELYVYHKL